MHYHCYCHYISPLPLHYQFITDVCTPMLVAVLATERWWPADQMVGRREPSLPSFSHSLMQQGKLANEPKLMHEQMDDTQSTQPKMVFSAAHNGC